MLYGSYGSDNLYGDGGNDQISGNLGDDVIGGGDGSDLIFGGSGNDEIYGGSGTDTIYGGAGNATIDTGFGLDDVYGGSGDDLIKAGQFHSELTGGTGADTFKFVSTEGTVRITDFSRASGDKIDLSALDPRSGWYGDQSFEFVGTNRPGEGQVGYYFYHAESSNKYYTFINGNMDEGQDLTIILEGLHILNESDFIL